VSSEECRDKNLTTNNGGRDSFDQGGAAKKKASPRRSSLGEGYLLPSSSRGGEKQVRAIREERFSVCKKFPFLVAGKREGGQKEKGTRWTLRTAEDSVVGERDVAGKKREEDGDVVKSSEKDRGRRGTSKEKKGSRKPLLKFYAKKKSRRVVRKGGGEKSDVAVRERKKRLRGKRTPDGSEGRRPGGRSPSG